MTLEYSSLILAVSVSCVAMSVTLAVSWLANRRDTFLLTWACAALVLVFGSAAFGVYADNPDTVPAVLGTTLILFGFVLCWGAARQFRLGFVPLRTVSALLLLMLALQLPFHLAGLGGTMLIVLNVGSALLLLMTAAEYWRARAENLSSLKWLTGLYVLEAVSFLCCAAMLVVESPLYLEQAPNNWAETFNAISSIIGVTGIGGLSLAINQERVARDHRVEARTDVLTGLLNRRAFNDLFAKVPPVGPSAIILFDLDNFKMLNDRHGHAFGDDVIRRFGQVCADGLRKQDIAARLGGEEFAVVLRDCSSELAMEVANRIRRRFAEQGLINDSETIRCTVSAGVHASRPGEQIAIAEMMNAADAALYAAKKSGRNRVCPSETVAAA